MTRDEIWTEIYDRGYKMKWINAIFIMIFLYSCNIENKKISHSKLMEKQGVSDDSNKTKTQFESKKDEFNVILGASQFKLENSDPKVIYLYTLINSKSLNKEVKSGKLDQDEYFTTYLGQIKLNELETHIFKQFYTVQAAIEKHGHSVIILVNKNGANYYDMETPENLPLDYKNGSFRYKYKNDTLKMRIEHASENDLVLRNMHNNK